ncbi:hypothetical protein AWC28_11090 [Mycolicibacter terrae]|nr:hypothetical protein AWC28_11090 [Mycolicibacter terrae]
MAVRDKQQGEVAAVDVAGQPTVVQGGHDGLASSGGCHNQVSVPVVQSAFGVELFEHLGLKGLRAYFQAGQGDRQRVALAVPGCGLEGLAESFPVLAGTVWLEIAVLPVGVEGSPEFLKKMWGGDRRKAHVPFQPVYQGSVREVAGTDVGGVEASVAPQQPRFRVQAGDRGVVVNPDLGAELVDQGVQGACVGGTEVGGGDDAQRNTALAQLGELFFQQPQALPFDESAQQIHSVGAGQFSAQLGGQGRLVAGIGHQGGVGKRRGWPWGFGGAQRRRVADFIEPSDLAGLVRVQGGAVGVGVGQYVQDAVGQGHAVFDGAGRPQ